MFITECRLFIKRKRIFVICILFSLGILLWGIKSATGEINAVLCLLRTIESAKYSFIFFLVISYMYIDENFRSGIAEVISSTNMGILKAVSYKLAVIQIWNVMLSAGFLVINIIFSLKMNSSTYMWYIVEMFALYFALPNLLASLFGLVLAGVQNKRIGYLGIILLSYVFAGGFSLFLQMMSKKIDIIYRLADIFCIFARGTRRAPNYYYLIPVEGNNWIRILLWIILLWILACCLFGTMKDKRRGAVLTGVCIILFCIYVQPFGGAYFDLHMTGHDEWSSDQYYYRIINQYEGEEEPADFQVLDYHIKLSVGRQLKADVTVKPDKTDLGQYAFTLYHGYRVSSVRNQEGNDIPYSRDKDYIRIENTGDSLDEIHICYEGYSLYFYSTSQGIRLPAYFPYYPIAGCRKIFDYEANQYMRDYKNTVSHFQLILEASEPVYCSLTQNEDGSYEGDAEGLTILGSRFAKCLSQDGLRIVYSELEYQEEEIKEYHRRLMESGVDEEPLEVVFCDAFGGYEKFYADQRQLITLGFVLEEDYGRYLDELKEEMKYD